MSTNEPLIDYTIINADQRDRMRKKVNNHSVLVSCSRHDLNHMIQWCRENVGEERPYHPIHEAEEGWMDYFEGDWALDRLETNFWFFNPQMLSAFMLHWSGNFNMTRPK